MYVVPSYNQMSCSEWLVLLCTATVCALVEVTFSTTVSTLSTTLENITSTRAFLCAFPGSVVICYVSYEGLDQITKLTCSLTRTISGIPLSNKKIYAQMGSHASQQTEHV